LKKISDSRRNWLDLRVKFEWRLCVKNANALKHAGKQTAKRQKCSVIHVPRLLVAERAEQRDRILDVAQQVRNVLVSSNSRVKLDFSRVEKIFPGGMLLLIASLQLICSTFPRRVSARCPPGSLAGQLLNHFGFASMLGVSPSLSKPMANSVVSWNFLTGTQSGGEEVRELLNQYRANTNAEIPPDLFAVLTEGLTNVRHHAYKDSDVPPEFQKWWLFARCTEPKGSQQGSLYIAIYDVGVGIPFTMRKKLQTGEVVLNYADKLGSAISLTEGTLLDQRLLTEAVERKRSQTGQPHRGNGLPEMREFVSSTDNGRLYIVSGHAQYTSVRGHEDGQTHGIRQKFPGTLLLWSLPLKLKESLP
jgi:hypothetical protein